jgi:LacI family transcriptional regulator
MPDDLASSTVSITEVAARAGVSIATVSRVVNGVAGKASAATVARVQAAVAELGYRPASAGRALRERSSRLVAVLAPNLANPAMAAIAASIEQALRGAGLVMVACDTHDDPSVQDEYLLEMRAQRVRATVLLGAVASPMLTRLAQSGEMLIFVGRRQPGGGTAPFIGIDNRQAGADVARHFRDRALPVRGILHGAVTSSATAERIQGFRAERAAQGMPLPDTAVLTLPAAEHTEIGYRCAPALFGAPGGIFCSSDLIAYGAHRAAIEHGLRVPQDITLFGFDDNPLNDWVAPWLSSVQVPYSAFGAAVAGVLDRLRRGEKVGETLLAHRVICRDNQR